MTQRIAAIVRQVVAICALVMGAVTAGVSAVHLPPAVSAVLTAAGGALLVVEHYVGDPSTGTTNAPNPMPVVVAPNSTVTPPAPPTPAVPPGA